MTENTHKLPVGPQLLTDLETGEVKLLEVREAKPKLQRIDLNLGGWLIMWQEAYKEMAKCKHLTVTDFRLRDYLIGILDNQNYIAFSQSELSQVLGIAQPHISTSLKKLIDLGIIENGPSNGRFKSYRLCPVVGWKGKLEHGAKEKKNSMRKKLKVIEGGKTDDQEQMKLF